MTAWRPAYAVFYVVRAFMGPALLTVKAIRWTTKTTTTGEG